MEAAYGVLRYLKNNSGQGLSYVAIQNHALMLLLMRIGELVQTLGDLLLVYVNLYRL